MLKKVFEELRLMGLCRSASEFSRDWLARDQSYYRSLKWHNREPSTQAITNCAAKLDELAKCFIRSGQHDVMQKGYRLLALARLCDDATPETGATSQSTI